MSEMAAQTARPETAQQQDIDLLIIVSTAQAAGVLVPLAAACRRRGLRWTCFFTNEGVSLLQDAAVIKAIKYAEEPIACEHSWARCAGEAPCPITLGSQTNNSALVGHAGKVISL
jgi:hypothetical protein